MAKAKIGKFEVDEAKLGRQHAEAIRRGKEKLKTEPQARSATYDDKTRRLVIELKNGATFIVPSDLVQGLRGADPKLIAEVELLPRGAALHWERLDVDLSLAGLIAGVFGGEAWMSSLAQELGRRGGSVKSEAKAAAVRANGRKGGRPSTKEKEKKTG
ncbi:MAG TPA: DUF2442 domain-containing protein [Pyrinomonadaceae bacterium]|jgi:hypothetical protein